MTSSTAETIVASAAQAAAALAAADPRAAALLALAPVVVNLIDALVRIQSGAIATAADVDAAFGQARRDVQAAHDQWAAGAKP